MAVLAPSILSADFARLGAEIKEVEAVAPPSCTWTSWTATSSPT